MFVEVLIKVVFFGWVFVMSFCFFFFSSRRRHTRYWRDWSSDVCSSDLCLLGLVLNFGPVAKLPYKAGPLADVFVVTTGGLGTIGIKSAEKTGDIIEFEFEIGRASCRERV